MKRNAQWERSNRGLLTAWNKKQTAFFLCVEKESYSTIHIEENSNLPKNVIV